MKDNSNKLARGESARPKFPRRALITAGMPYGNKDLHFGHIGGVFVHADAFARFLRDRLGKENVIFVSGTDCYGSSVVEDYRALRERGEHDGNIEDFVKRTHDSQRSDLKAYDIDLNLFAASSLGRPAEIHESLCADLTKRLHANHFLEIRETRQFFDAAKEVFLNGRQVLGQCPIHGCRSERAYADECSLGHQFEPQDLVNPVSTLSGTVPDMRPVANWYFKLPEFRDFLTDWLHSSAEKPWHRQFMTAEMAEFLEPPTIYVKEEFLPQLESEIDGFPEYTVKQSKSDSTGLVFDNLDEREQACTLLTRHGIRYRTGKTLVPFRLTGNTEWGVPAPDLDRPRDLTFWVWPESLIAPISFTAAYLEQQGEDPGDWKGWWCSDDCQVYQFIGEDNLFFYGPAEMAMFEGMRRSDSESNTAATEIRLPVLIANKHLLFLNKKASSSDLVKPPMARDLLNNYTSDQLRTHFLSLGLGLQNVSFQPKPLNPKADERAGDPVMKEGNLISNVLNRAVRTCFYTMQKHFGGKIPAGDVSTNIRDAAESTILAYEGYMYLHQFHLVVETVDRYIRGITKHWAKYARKEPDGEIDPQAFIDSFHMVRVATVLMHPIAPHGTEMVRQYLNVGEEFWSWDRIFDTLNSFMDDPAEHEFKVLEPRVDFFEKHPSQIRRF